MGPAWVDGGTAPEVSQEKWRMAQTKRRSHSYVGAPVIFGQEMADRALKSGLWL
jgi:hypothetical protein